MFRSIRWRLPLSYAAIALLAALSLGAVLLAILRGYYARQEVEYLRGNAKAVGAVVTEMLLSGQPPEAIQSQIQVYALLSQLRVQVWDAQGRLLAEANPPDRAQVVSVVKKAADATVAASPSPGKITSGPVESEPVKVPDQALVGLKPQMAGQTLYVNVFVRPPDGVATSAGVAGTAMVVPAPPGMGVSAPPDYVSSISVVGTRLGIGFDPTAAWDGRRSSQTVREQIAIGEGGQPLGTLQLSNGPAYGLDIVESVARGWAVASAVAVVLAALAGWLISCGVSRPVLALSAVTARMADGDLAARADMARKDEFGQLAGSFNRMAARVEGTVTALRRFVADAAHELHTPLTALHTDLELAASEGDATTRVDLIQRAQEQVARLEALTASLLDLSRLEAGAQAAPAPLDLAALAREAGELYASQAEQAGLAFEMDVPQDEVTIRGDPAQLRRALGNLLDNACKFTPEGGAVSLRLRCAEGWAELAVEDTGIGIPEGDLPQIFGRFHRGRNAAGYPGNGLGLAIVRAIAEAHGGEVCAEDTGHGARFTLRLKTSRV